MKLFTIGALLTVSFLSANLNLNLFLNHANAQTQPIKEWTVLVYLNADNDLYRFGFLNMAQMEKVGSTNSMNVVVQFDPEPKGMPTTRYFVTKNDNPVTGKITSQVLETMPETDMGNAKTLSEFLAWGVKAYPAKKYAVIIWNHGNGWQGVSYDDNPSTHLTMPALRAGLENMNAVVAQQRRVRNTGGQIDLLNFDACIMSTLEVAYELKDTAKFMVGSQFNEPGEGENYTMFLTPMAAKPTMSARELSEVLVYQYSLNYQNRSSINYAAVDMSRVGNYVGQFNASIGIVNGSPVKDGIRKGFSSGSFDLVTGLNSAREAATADPNSAAALDTLLVAYGYPKEATERPSSQESLRSGLSVKRFFPGVVNYRYQLNGPWQQAQMQLGQAGQYEFKFPKGRPAQYYVTAVSNQRGRQVTYREALTSVVRNDANPIVFHNQFPETSPLVADSYSLSTRGAHGMTLYSLAGMASQRNPSTQNFGRGIITSYKELLFARTGAPNWTMLFGL